MALGPPAVKVEDPGTREDGTFKSSKDNLDLYYFRYLPSTASTTAPRAHLIFSHGFIEHSGRYFNIFPLFPQANISVTAYDLRGYGWTWSKHPTPKKAHGNTTWKQQFEDLEDLVRLERKRLDGQYGVNKVPIYLMGHSMGGGITFAFLTRPEDSTEGPSQEVKDMVSGVILSSPWIKLTNPPPGILFWLAPRLIRMYYDMPWYAVVNVKECTSDVDAQKWTSEDPLVDGHVYLRAITGPLFGGVKLFESEYKNWPQDKSLLIVHGEKDPVTSCAATAQLVEKVQAKDKEHKGFAGLLHECWHEKGDAKVEFAQYIIE